ncbi:MAG TPA: hypothetical protein VD794_03755, partial [Flavisolibacter sp.]|nr:hypothetical protein [Flavisolibacter sp.]
MKYLTITAVFILFMSCNQATSSLDKVDANKSLSYDTDTESLPAVSMSEGYPSLFNGHPKAQSLMNEAWYYSPVDDMAPFGSDDAADTYAYFKEWRSNNPQTSPKAFLLQHFKRWGYPLFDLETTEYENIKPYLEQSELGSRLLFGIDAAIVATAFGQLYLEGKVDAGMKALAKKAIQRQLL